MFDALVGSAFGSPSPISGWSCFPGCPCASQAAIADHLRREWLSAPITDAMVAILREGSATLDGLANVAPPGSYGYQVNALAAQGLMWCDWTAGGTTYTLTEAGREYLEKRRKADLARIGVYEITT